MSILLADDDAQLATFLSKSLESEGYAVHTALDESTVLAELERQNYKLIILDLNFGQTDGLQLLEKLRAGGLETPVMVLSARNRVSDRIESLNLGADDYVTKPFSFQELAARANAILRRKADPSLSVMRVEDLELDPALRKVRRGKREIKLSPKEFGLLQYLMRHAGETVTRKELLQESWGTQETDSNLVDVYVNYLRKKIDASSPERLLHTVRGAGYRLGRPAPLRGTGRPSSVSQSVSQSAHGRPAAPAPSHTATSPETAQALQATSPAWRQLVHSVAHDVAQPLTSVRCFLEVLATRTGNPALPTIEARGIEQQADRAIALVKGISGMVREVPPSLGPWISLEILLDEVFNDFTLVLHSGLINLERQWDPSIQVTSSPLLRQLLTLCVSKLIGRNTRPLALVVASKLSGENHCDLQLRWRALDSPPNPLPDGKNILTKELGPMREIILTINGELVLPEGRNEIILRVPTAPAGSREGFVH
jgi:DNA-binding response OmpR family regulator